MPKPLEARRGRPVGRPGLTRPLGLGRTAHHSGSCQSREARRSVWDRRGSDACWWRAGDGAGDDEHRCQARRGTEHARMQASVGRHWSGSAPPGAERGRTNTCERRRLPGDALIKLEVGRGLGEQVPVRHRLGRIVPGGRSACGRDRGWTWRLTDMGEDLLDGCGSGDEGDDARVRAAVGTGQGQRLEQPGQRACGVRSAGRKCTDCGTSPAAATGSKTPSMTQQW